ncbi:MAG: hypothetical protein WD607_03665 [Candidatus Paceibacterota bacterium]
MSKKRILIVGNANHSLITNYVKWLKKTRRDLEIDILTDRLIKNSARVYYNNVYYINFYNLLYSIIQRIPGIRALYASYLYSNIIKEVSKYEFVHIHFLSMHFSYFIFLVKKYTNTKVITTIWGSDFSHHYYKDKKLFKTACSLSDKITFANKKKREKFIEKFQWKKDNLLLCRFGLAPLEILKEINITKEEAKKKLGWDHNKIAVTIGYNLNPLQQHLKILQELNSLKEYHKDIELILPLTYGGNKAYKRKLLKTLNKLPFNYRIYDEYLSDYTVSLIRKASQIMIQLQKTDQFSGSMQEHLYTRNVVITGSWLPYQTMKDYGINFLEVERIDQLSGTLIQVLKNYNNYHKDTSANPAAVLELSLWEKNISNWAQLYE